MNYLIDKIITSIKIKTTLKRIKYKPGIYCQPPIKSAKTIGIDLSNSRYIHFGDQLFYEPLIRALHVSGLNIRLTPTIAMNSYFTSCGFSISNIEETLNSDILISPIWDISNKKTINHKNRILVHLSDYLIDDHPCRYLISSLSEILDIELKIASYKPYYWESDLSRNIIKYHEQGFIILNNYVESSRLRVWKNDHHALLDHAAAIKKSTGKLIIHVGSEKDKKSDNYDYSGVTDIDLRGLTSIEEIFSLIKNPLIHDVVSFDNFITHIALMAGKQCHIRMRRHSPKVKKYHQNYIYPSFEFFLDFHSGIIIFFSHSIV